jgi:hypothetical protein
MASLCFIFLLLHSVGEPERTNKQLLAPNASLLKQTLSVLFRQSCLPSVTHDWYPCELFGTRMAQRAMLGGVPVPTARRVLGLRMEERPPEMEGSSEYIE